METDNADSVLSRIYAAFNRRDIDSVLEALHPAVDWPNGWEGGRVTGPEEVRSYWIRQWAAIDPTVVPIAFEHKSDDRVVVRVHQTVRDSTGNILNDGEVLHIYTFEKGLIKAMDIAGEEKAE